MYPKSIWLECNMLVSLEYTLNLRVIVLQGLLAEVIDALNGH